MTPEVRRWYQKIGARGGQAGKGTAVRSKLMSDAAHARWDKAKAKKAKERKAARSEAPAIGFKIQVIK